MIYSSVVALLSNVGLVFCLDVVFAQQTLLQNEQSRIQVAKLQAVATVSVIQAIGGGWLLKDSRLFAHGVALDETQDVRIDHVSIRGRHAVR